jgi:hypothetical protein
MKYFLSTLTLICVVSLTAVAGNIPTDGVTAPAPDQTETIPQPGEIPTVGSSYEITDTALDLIQMLISVGI